MRKMHELKIPDTIINVINQAGHDMDLQVVYDAETGAWKFSENWGKKKMSEFKKGEIVLIEFVSSNFGVNYSLGFISYIDTTSLDIAPLGLSILYPDGNALPIREIYIYGGNADVYTLDEQIPESSADDTINIFKL